MSGSVRVRRVLILSLILDPSHHLPCNRPTTQPTQPTQPPSKFPCSSSDQHRLSRSFLLSPSYTPPALSSLIVHTSYSHPLISIPPAHCLHATLAVSSERPVKFTLKISYQPKIQATRASNGTDHVQSINQPPDMTQSLFFGNALASGSSFNVKRKMDDGDSDDEGGNQVSPKARTRWGVALTISPRE